MESGQFRDFSEFCEQLNEIKLKFHKWDSCEKTVGLYYLMVGLPFGNARFLQYALEHSITAVNSPETRIVERNANDIKFVSNFLLEQPQLALTSLLIHLPLLKPGNKETAECYLRVIKQVLLEFITPPLKIYNECVEIMSYVYIHPAFSNDDKRSFKNLLKQVLNKVTPSNFVHSPATESSDECVSPNPESNENLKRMNRRSNSLTPAQENGWYSQDSLSQPSCKHSKPRSYSLSSEKSLLAGISNLPASRSETRLQDLMLMNNLPAMRSIVSWLKSLRLHKYSWVFNNLTYNRMINLTEETLQGIGITKGARHKLLLSISKLKERSSMLTELETEVMNGGDLNIAMKKLKGVVQTPLQISLDDEDLSSQFVKVMGKVCTQLLMLRQPSDDYIMMFSSLCERASTEDSFTDEQKRRLNVWKSQLLKEETISVYNHCQQHSSTNYGSKKESKNSIPIMCSSVQSSTYTKKSSSYPNMKNKVILKNHHRHSVGSETLQNHLFSAPQNQHIFKQSSTVDYNDLTKKALENNTNKFRVQLPECKIRQEQNSHNTDIESSLESLCIQMMEHALGP